jgi:uncharacterized membrane protein YhaH (DUF805 family)
MPLGQLLFSFQGRINRKPWWLASLATTLIAIVALGVIFVAAGGVPQANAVDSLASMGGSALAMALLIIPLLWMAFALGAKRLHDRNMSASWLILFYLLPGVLDNIGSALGASVMGWGLTIVSLAISLWALVELGFLRGTVGPNQYGPDPLEGKV